MPHENAAPTIAILGATGLVGETLIKMLEERNVSVGKLVPLASERSAGKTITFRGETIPVIALSAEAFQGVDIVLASAGGSISAEWAPIAVKAGAVVIDNTSHFRMDTDVPLVVAGVNDAACHNHNGIIANPNCSTAQLMPVLKALNAANPLTDVIIATYQSVSGAGKDAMQELAEHSQTTPCPEPSQFQRSIAFNLIPHIDVFMDDWQGDTTFAGYTKEEAKLILETRKILDLPKLPITATAVRVPVMVGHSEAVTLRFANPMAPQTVAQILAETPHVIVGHAPHDYHTPKEIAGTDPVYVSRIRRDTASPAHGIQLWVVADNLRIGAALNAVRIAEYVIAHQLYGKTPAIV